MRVNLQKPQRGKRAPTPYHWSKKLEARRETSWQAAEAANRIGPAAGRHAERLMALAEWASQR